MNRIVGGVFLSLFAAPLLLEAAQRSPATRLSAVGQARTKQHSPLGQKKHAVPRRWRPGKPIRGIAFHFCSCTAPCGCMFNTKDMEGCDLVAVYHYTDGGYVGKHIDGQTVVLAYRPKRLRSDKEKQNDLKNYQGKPVDLVVYLPKDITPKQEQDLKFILVEHNMGLATGEFLFRRAPIVFRSRGDGYDVTIPEVFHAHTQAMRGGSKKQMEVRNVSFAESHRWLLGKTTVHDYADPQETDWKWSLPKGSNGAWANFVWEENDHGP